MSQPEDHYSPPPGGGFVGCALVALGAIIVLPSGLCTAFGGFALISEFVANPEQIATNLPEFLPVIVITLGALAGGIALIWAGLHSRRS